MRDLLEEYQRLAAPGPVGRAVVTRVWGSAPRPEGAVLLSSADGRMAGSVSGGCVETAAAEEVRAAIARGNPKLVSWGVTHERAWELGLSCGGTIEVFIEPAVRPELVAAARRTTASVVATVIGGAGPVGGCVVVAEEQPVSRTGVPDQLGGAMEARGRARLGRLTSSVESLDSPMGPVEVFFEAFPQRPTLLIFGGVHVAMALVRLAGPLGYRTVVADGREQFLTRERFPGADALILGWPDEAFRQAGLDAATCVCLLTHDPKFDEPALELALRSDACYIGAIGSRKTQASRRERLRAAGFGAAEVARLHGPIGLDIGGRTPEEIALAIMAEITAVRYGRDLPGPDLSPVWYYLLKPAATAAIYWWVRAHGDGGEPRYRRLVLGGLLASLAGDILLMIPANFFLAGLLAFLLAHLCYIAAFCRGASWTAAAVGLLPFGIAAAALVHRLWPGLPISLRIPVIGYSTVITIMAGAAAGRWISGAGRSGRLAAAGAILFFGSDAALALNRFGSPFGHASVVVLGTYYAAQVLIALSVAAGRPSPGPGPGPG